MQILSPLDKGLEAAVQEVIVGVGHLSVDVDVQNPDLVRATLGAAQTLFVSGSVEQLEAQLVMSHARFDRLDPGTLLHGCSTAMPKQVWAIVRSLDHHAHQCKCARCTPHNFTLIVCRCTLACNCVCTYGASSQADVAACVGQTSDGALTSSHVADSLC